MSKAAAGLQALRIDNAPRSSRTRIETINEEGATSVQHAKVPRSTTRIKSLQIGTSTSTMTAAVDAGNSQAGFSNWAGNRNRFGSRPGVPSAAAASRASAYTSNDWRAPRATRFNDPNIPSFKGSEQWNTRPNLALNYGKCKVVYSKESYHLGMIFRAFLHEEDYMATNSTVTVQAPNKSVTSSQWGDIHTKERKMIVVACHSKHIVSVPMYTHNGRGLVNKNPDEYISVRDHRDQRPGFQRLSKHGQLMTGYLNDGINLFDHMSTAHFTYHVSRSYDLPIIYEGHLSTDSINHLVELFNRYAPKKLPK